MMLGLLFTSRLLGQLCVLCALLAVLLRPQSSHAAALPLLVPGTLQFGSPSPTWERTAPRALRAANSQQKASQSGPVWTVIPRSVVKEGFSLSPTRAAAWALAGTGIGVGAIGSLMMHNSHWGFTDASGRMGLALAGVGGLSLVAAGVLMWKSVPHGASPEAKVPDIREPELQPLDAKLHPKSQSDLAMHLPLLGGKFDASSLMQFAR